jgi:hypothetical protein
VLVLFRQQYSYLFFLIHSMSTTSYVLLRSYNILINITNCTFRFEENIVNKTKLFLHTLPLIISMYNYLV